MVSVPPGGTSWVTTRRGWAAAGGGVAAAVAEPLDVEVEAVQVHRVRLRAEVEHPPPHRLAEAIGQSLGGRPAEAVEHEGDARLTGDERLADVVGGEDLAEIVGVRLVHSVMTSTRSAS